MPNSYFPNIRHLQSSSPGSTALKHEQPWFYATSPAGAHEVCSQNAPCITGLSRSADFNNTKTMPCLEQNPTTRKRCIIDTQHTNIRDFWPQLHAHVYGKKDDVHSNTPNNSVEKRSKVKWKSSKSVVKWSEVKCSVVRGEWEFMGRVYEKSKLVRSEGLGWKREYYMCGEREREREREREKRNTGNYTQYFLNLVLFPFYTCCILRCLVCTVVVVLCVLLYLSCVYCCHLMRICCTVCVCVCVCVCVYCCFYLCRTVS